MMRDAHDPPPYAGRIFLWHWGKEGAGAKFTHALAKGLRNRNDRQLHLSAAASSDLAHLLEGDDDLQFHSVPIFTGDKARLSGKIAAGLALLRLPALGFAFQNAVRSFKPDIALCTFTSLWDIATLPIIARGKMRFALIVHDAEPHPGDAYPFRATAMRLQIQAADSVIVLSDHVAHAISNLYGFPEERIFKIPHGQFTFDESTPRRRRFPTDRPFRLLFLGRILSYKGLDLLLDAYRRLINEAVPLHLSIKGSGSLAAYRSPLAQMPEITVYNAWMGDDEIAAALADADAVVLPYREASQSGIAASAFAAGLPVIATPVGGLTEQIAQGETGLISTEITAESLARTIADLVSQPPLYEHLSRGALDHAQRTLDWRIIGDRLGAILDHVAAEPRRGGP